MIRPPLVLAALAALMGGAGVALAAVAEQQPISRCAPSPGRAFFPSPQPLPQSPQACAKQVPRTHFAVRVLSAPERNRRLSSEVGDECFHLEPNFERQLPRMLPMEHATSPSRIPAFQVEYSTAHSYTQ